MIGLNWPRSYSNRGDYGSAYSLTPRPARSSPVQVISGRLRVAGAPTLGLFFTSHVNGAAIPKAANDAELRATIRRTYADGYNGWRIRSISDDSYTESAFNWGLWKYKAADPEWSTVANRWLLEDLALIQLGKSITWALDEGFECVYIDLEGFEEMIKRHSSQHAPGTYQGRGMQWSAEYQQIAWEFYVKVMVDVNPYTGTRLIDHPRIIWLFNNECGFGNSYTSQGTATWGGGSSVQWFDKIVDGTTDTFGDNGYWYTELNAKLTAWKNTYASGWTIPAWGRGSTGVADGVVGFPKKSVWSAWATGATPAVDKANLLAFIDQMDVDYMEDLITRLRAYRSNLVVCTGTWHYSSPRSHVGLRADLQVNTFVEKHGYFNDGTGAGVKTGSAVTRKSIMDLTWSYAGNGGGWSSTGSVLGCRASYGGFMNSECGQYSPNRWRYQRWLYEAMLATMHGYEVSDFNQCQQVSADHYTSDGRYMSADHINVSSPTARLCVRAIAPILKFGLSAELSSVFQSYQTKASIATYQAANSEVGFEGNKMNAAFSGSGYEHGQWGGKKFLFDIDETKAGSETSVYTTAPKITDANLNIGTYSLNSGGHKVYVQGGYGAQWETPYLCAMIDTITATPIWTMPLAVSSMVAAVTCGVILLRSDGPWLLFTGPMGLFIFGSDYDTVLVTQTAGPGEASFMTTDEVTVNYSSGVSQVWLSSPSTANQRLMMPEAFTVSLDTTAAGGVELEVFKITKEGTPVRVSSTYNAGTKVNTFAYDSTSPEYKIQPKNTSPAITAQRMPR